MRTTIIIAVVSVLISITAITISYIAEKNIPEIQEPTFRRLAKLDEQLSFKKMGWWPEDENFISVEIIGRGIDSSSYEVKAVIWTYDKIGEPMK